MGECNMVNILLYGLGQWFINRADVLRMKFNIVGVTDKNVQKKKVADLYKLPFYQIDEIAEVEFDYLFIALQNAGEVKSLLASSLKLGAARIIDGTLWWNEQKKSDVTICHYGKNNPGIKFLLIRRISDDVGLFSNFLVFMQYIRIALIKGYIPVIDMQNFPNAYLEDKKIGKENSWEYYFKQPFSQYSLSDVYKSHYVELCSTDIVPDFQYSYEKVLENAYIRHVYHYIYYKHMCITDSVIKEANDIKDKLFGKYQKDGKKVCGVLLRGTDYVKFKPYNHPVQPTIEQAIKNIHELITEWGIDYLYFSSEDKKILQAMQDEFGSIYLEYDCPRFVMDEKAVFTGKDSLAPYYHYERENDCYLKGKEYLLSMILMTYCDSFIAGNTSGTLGVLVMKESFEHEYIFDLGRYGINADSYIYTPSGEPIIIEK